MFASFLKQLTLVEVLAFFAGVNAGLLLLSIATWHAVRRWHAAEFDVAQSLPVSVRDCFFAIGSALTCNLVSLTGWWLWQHQQLTVRPTTTVHVVLDFLLMLLVMDFAMYVTHRMAHWPLIFDAIHQPHHEHTNTNCLSLFVLHPAEVLGFGGLLIGAVWVVTPCEEALIGYLLANVIVGTIGHAGLTTTSERPRHWIGKWLGSSAFHGRHHTNAQCNFGFYTAIWDRLLKTIGHAEDKGSSEASRSAT